MSTIVKLVQGSAEWHEHRKIHRNASETAAVLGLSPYQTVFQLWQIRTGRVQVEATAAMAHGTQLEPAAREAYEQLTGHLVQPLVLVDGEYSSSLDGITLGGELIVELKCPKSKDSKLLRDARSGRVPIHVYWQIQTQLLVSRAELAHLYVYANGEGILLEQKPELEAWGTIRRDWDRFMDLVRTDQPPPLMDRDTRLRDDPEWLEAAAAYLELRAAYDELSTKCDAAKERLIAQASHAKEQGGGVSVTRYWKNGAIDYKKIPELQVLDLEQYRAASREETRVTTM